MTSIVETLLAEVESAGGELVVTGPDRLIVRAGPAPVPAELVARLRAHKPELMAALRPRSKPSSSVTRAEWDAADWRAYYDERAAIREFDGKMPRREAERFAWSELQCEWHRRHGKHSPAWQCGGCQKPLSGSPASVLPDGECAHESLECLIAYGRRWRAAATVTLVKMGLPKPASLPEDDMAAHGGWGRA